MGTWGYGPFDNDTAQDWLMPIERNIHKAIHGGLLARRADSEEVLRALAAIGLLVNLYDGPMKQHPIGSSNAIVAPSEGVLDAALEVVEFLRSDEEWIAQWKSPRKFVNSLDQLAKQLHVLRKRARRPLKGRQGDDQLAVKSGSGW